MDSDGGRVVEFVANRHEVRESFCLFAGGVLNDPVDFLSAGFPVPFLCVVTAPVCAGNMGCFFDELKVRHGIVGKCQYLFLGKGR